MVKTKLETTEQRILAAARVEFLQKGMAGARMQDIADKAGINKALLHYYFRNKTQLFQMVLREALVRMIQPLAAIWTTGDSVFRKIEQFVDQYIDVLLANPMMPGFILNELRRDPVVLAELFSSANWTLPATVRESISAAAEAGEIVCDHPEDVLLNIISLCVFPMVGREMVMLNFQLTDDDFNALIIRRKRTVSEFVIRAIRP